MQELVDRWAALSVAREAAAALHNTLEQVPGPPATRVKIITEHLRAWEDVPERMKRCGA